MSKPSGTGNMRIGLLTILTVVIVIVLAVLSVLEVTTAGAMRALTARQATMTTEAYRAETCGQQLVARVDAQLAQSKASGADRAAALDALSGKLSGISSVVSTSDVTAIARVDGSKVEATITTTGGRTLTVTINVTDDLACDVSAWRLAAVSADEKDATTLWGGPGTN
ncbi:hypothetical protein [Olsenella intestinalis]|uniref:hypothetical protein n=1 Tax=Olsenella intestinalis TaxID=2930083 RepID=UPI0020109C2B|nr:hypothetical protein [Olsenella intestinalis]